MAIIYPVSLPSSPGFVSSSIRMIETVSETKSPFTSQSQFVEHAGNFFEADLTLPTMRREEAAVWIGFFASLKGKIGTFNFGDPDAREPQGVATGTPLINGNSQTGRTLNTKGWTAAITGILKVGDFIQIGTELKMVTVDADSDGSGLSSLEIFPSIRISPSDNDPIVTSSPVGLFRMVSNVSQYNADHLHHYGISFAIKEAL